MFRRRETLGLLAATGLAALAGCGDRATTPTPGGTTPADRTPSTGGATTTGSGLTVTSSAFADGGAIPERYTADGADVSPPLSIGGVPDGAETLALVVDDPDAPGGTFVHWLLWNLPAGRARLPEGVPRSETLPALGGARQGTNDFGVVGYRGPAPPAGDDAHTYRFTVSAVDRVLTVPAGAERGALADALSGATIATGRLTGEYDR